MTFPDAVSMVTDPHAETIKNKYFTSTVSSYFRGNIAKVSIDLATMRSHVDAEDTGKYAEDLRATNKAIGGYFALGKWAIKSTDEAGKAEFPQRLRKLKQELIDKTTETIKSGKLAPSDMADAYCIRSNALSDLQRFDEAAQDANEAMRLAPKRQAPLAVARSTISTPASSKKALPIIRRPCRSVRRRARYFACGSSPGFMPAGWKTPGRTLREQASSPTRKRGRISTFGWCRSTAVSA